MNNARVNQICGWGMLILGGIFVIVGIIDDVSLARIIGRGVFSILIGGGMILRGNRGIAIKNAVDNLDIQQYLFLILGEEYYNKALFTIGHKGMEYGIEELGRRGVSKEYFVGKSHKSNYEAIIHNLVRIPEYKEAALNTLANGELGQAYIDNIKGNLDNKGIAKLLEKALKDDSPLSLEDKLPVYDNTKKTNTKPSQRVLPKTALSGNVKRICSIESPLQFFQEIFSKEKYKEMESQIGESGIICGFNNAIASGITKVELATMHPDTAMNTILSQYECASST
ncbi:MAG: hypothetical protein FWH42_01470 [Dehalococcoidia bacterium]|nr:hypothetical protein [Dehalococcoidia bacterium]